MADITAFDLALREATRQAAAKYPNEVNKITRGADLCKRGMVTLVPEDHIGLVQSGTHSDVVYRCNGQCQCLGFIHASNGHCSHRFAVALFRRATSLMEHMWYASYDSYQGIVMQKDGNYIFYNNEGAEYLINANDPWLVLGGNCLIIDIQRKADGELWRKVADSANYSSWRMAR